MKLDRRNLLKQFSLGIAARSFLKSSSGAVPIVSMDDEPKAAVEKSMRQGSLIHLDRNENPYGASKQAIAALRESADHANLYPENAALQKALAAHHNVSAEQIVLGCGSSDALRMAASALLESNSTLVTPTPTCELMGGYARSLGVRVAEVPLRKDHSHDLQAMLESARNSGPSRRVTSRTGGLVYICNPNSPTGTITTRKELDDFLGKVPSNFHVVIDEAYNHYAGGSGAYVSFLERPHANPRVIVTRTFSTSYGLAGARIGYAVAAVPVAAKMMAASLPFPVNRPGMFAAIAALQDGKHIEESVKRNSNDRQEFLNQVNARMLRALDSHTNFICLNVMRPAGEILEHYRKNNFALPSLIPGMPTYLRISLGSPEEMAEFWRVWDMLGSHPMSM